MKRIKLTVKKNQFEGDYYITKKSNTVAFITLLGNEKEITFACAKYAKKRKINILGLYPFKKEKKTKRVSDFDASLISQAIKYLHDNGISKIGLLCGSIYSVIGLYSASIFPDITGVMAFSPIDYIPEGYVQGKKDKMVEWPSGTSLIKETTFQSFHMEEKDYNNMIVSLRKKFKEPHTLEIYNKANEEISIPERAYLKVERINGPLLLIGAEDDSMWDTVKAIHRMEKRLKEIKFRFEFTTFTPKYGTHFVFPQTLIKHLKALGGTYIIKQFASGRKNKKQCQDSREVISLQVDDFLTKFLNN